ncbi:MAG: AAA family ATPase, partial [Bacteroidales bacterium]|nr:AAA family ATPase [Bacteroidales bacterium]
MKKIPIGIQAFSSLIKEGFVYLDKTDMIYNIANNKACYFLSRPRRFGKSLTLSTLHEYFDGQKDLFKGLKIEKMETKWEKYPVLHFDLNTGTYNTVEDVQSRISYMLSQHEKQFGKDEAANKNSERFESLVNAAATQTGKEVVVLVDE